MNGESVDHRGAWQKSINATNTKSKQTYMTSFVGIATTPVVIATHFPLNVIPGLLCHGYFYDFVQYGKVKHSLAFLEFAYILVYTRQLHAYYSIAG